jgi:enamine deaminase RidA (YjgF/YER057c/UK114 family)
VDFSACLEPKSYILTAEPIIAPPFSAAVLVDGYIHCAGTRPRTTDGARSQAVSCLDDLSSILRQAGSGPEQVYALTACVAERDLPALESSLDEWGNRDMVKEADFVSRPCGPHLMEIACSAQACVRP